MSCLPSSGGTEWKKLIFMISDTEKKKTLLHYKAYTLKLLVETFFSSLGIRECYG